MGAVPWQAPFRAQAGMHDINAALMHRSQFNSFYGDYADAARFSAASTVAASEGWTAEKLAILANALGADKAYLVGGDGIGVNWGLNFAEVGGDGFAGVSYTEYYASSDYPEIREH